MSMNSPPSSLASLLSGVPNAYTAPPAQAQAEDGNHDAIIMTYLRENYEGNVDENAQNRYLNSSGGNGAAASGTGAGTGAGTAGSYRPLAPGPSRSALPTSAAAPPSPPDPSIPIPAALASLAEPLVESSAALFAFELPPAHDEVLLGGDAMNRGEMGGKRRKAPHERAGWKEMDDDRRGVSGGSTSGTPGAAAAASATAPRGEKRPRSAEDDSAAQAQNAAEAAATLMGFDGVMPDPAPDVPSATAAADATPKPDEAQPPAADDEGPPAKRQQKSKEARAEQNRKAQQIFRRKREEKIKQLELDSLALHSTRQRLHAAEQRLHDMAFELEAKMIENAGLRRALGTAVSGTGSSMMREDGTLILSAEEYEQRDKSKNSVAHVDAGCEALARAARQLAKANRQRREDIHVAHEASQHAQS